jgi:Ca2+-binding EF-hand superfamily protein
MSISSIGSSRGFDSSQMAAKMVKDLDTNNDNTLSKAEFVDGLKSKGVAQADAEKMFSSLDTKGTGKVTQTDIEASIKKMGDQGGAPPSGGGAQGKAKSDDSKVYDEKDTNKDGVVSALEELAYNLTHIQNTNKDQKSSANENDAGLTGTLDVTV